jgi:putative ABC transport system permease protein
MTAAAGPLRLSLATIRARWVSFAGAFFAIAGGVAIIVPMLLLVAAGLGTPFPGPQRFAAAPAVVVPGDGLNLAEDGRARRRDHLRADHPRARGRARRAVARIPGRAPPVNWWRGRMGGWVRLRCRAGS